MPPLLFDLEQYFKCFPWGVETFPRRFYSQIAKKPPQKTYQSAPAVMSLVFAQENMGFGVILT